MQLNTDMMQAIDIQHLQKELAARYASLFMICYRRRDISGMHISLTAFTHVMHSLNLWPQKDHIMQQMQHFILLEGFPQEELAALQWLLNHYFEQSNSHDESLLLGWYQQLDDEWVLRKKLRSLFPQHSNSQLTLLIAEQMKAGDDNAG